MEPHRWADVPRQFNLRGSGNSPSGLQRSMLGGLTGKIVFFVGLVDWLIGCMREFGWKSFLRIFSYENYFGFTRFHSLSEHVPFVHRWACGLGTAMVASLVPTNQAAEGGNFFHPSIQPLMIDGNCQVLLGLQVLRCLGWYHKGNLEGLVRICPGEDGSLDSCNRKHTWVKRGCFDRLGLWSTSKISEEGQDDKRNQTCRHQNVERFVSSYSAR